MHMKSEREREGRERSEVGTEMRALDTRRGGSERGIVRKGSTP